MAFFYQCRGCLVWNTLNEYIFGVTHILEDYVAFSFSTALFDGTLSMISYSNKIIFWKYPDFSQLQTRLI